MKTFGLSYFPLFVRHPNNSKDIAEKTIEGISSHHC